MALFSIEAVIKLIALGPCVYFKDPWNNLDFFIVLISYVSVIAKGSNVDTGRRALTMAVVTVDVRPTDYGYTYYGCRYYGYIWYGCTLAALTTAAPTTPWP